MQSIYSVHTAFLSLFAVYTWLSAEHKVFFASLQLADFEQCNKAEPYQLYPKPK
jgi:hypothetical protein